MNTNDPYIAFQEDRQIGHQIKKGKDREILSF